MADYYVNALEALTGISARDAMGDVSGLENLGSAASRVAGVRPGQGVSTADQADISFAHAQSPSSQVNGQMADAWESIRRGNNTYYFSSATDAQGRYHAAVEARANEVVASFAGDAEDIGEIRNRLLRGESLDSVLADVREKRHDLNVAAAVAKNKSTAQAMVNNDIVDPNIHESSSVAYAKDGSTAGASSGKESSSAAHAEGESTAGAYSDGNSTAAAKAKDGSHAVSGAFEQSMGFASARNKSEATVDANNGATAEAEADLQGVSRSEARNDSRATSRARAGDAHAEATTGSTAQATSEQDRHMKFEVGKDAKSVWGALRQAGWSDEEIVKQKLVDQVARENQLKDPNVVQPGQKLRVQPNPSRRPSAEAEAREYSEASATARGPDSHAGALSDQDSKLEVHSKPFQSHDIKASPPRE